MLVVESMSYSNVGILTLIQCQNIDQCWTDEQNDVGPTLHCNIGLKNWWRYANVGPTN